MSKIVKVKLDDESEAYVEVSDLNDNDSGFIEATTRSSAKEDSDYIAKSDYITVASNVMKNLKNSTLAPDSIELSFSIKLSATTGKILSWVIADAGAQTNLGIKMKWKKQDSKSDEQDMD